MGSDKGLITSGGETWAQLTLDKLQSLPFRVVVSVRRTQFENYAALFFPDQMIVDDDASNIAGPLKGILTVHDRFPDMDLFVLACDLPKMERYVLEHLYAQYQDQHADITLFLNDAQIEPLCAIYRAAGLARIKHDYLQQKLTRYSLHHVIERLSTHRVPLKKDWQSCFRNFNSPDDLARPLT